MKIFYNPKALNFSTFEKPFLKFIFFLLLIGLVKSISAQNVVFEKRVFPYDAKPGDTLTYFYIIRNYGPATLFDLQLSSPLSSNLEYIPNSTIFWYFSAISTFADSAHIVNDALGGTFPFQTINSIVPGDSLNSKYQPVSGSYPRGKDLRITYRAVVKAAAANSIISDQGTLTFTGTTGSPKVSTFAGHGAGSLTTVPVYGAYQPFLPECNPGEMFITGYVESPFYANDTISLFYPATYVPKFKSYNRTINVTRLYKISTITGQIVGDSTNWLASFNFQCAAMGVSPNTRNFYLIDRTSKNYLNSVVVVQYDPLNQVRSELCRAQLTTGGFFLPGLFTRAAVNAENEKLYAIAEDTLYIFDPTNCLAFQKLHVTTTDGTNIKTYTGGDIAFDYDGNCYFLAYSFGEGILFKINVQTGVAEKVQIVRDAISNANIPSTPGIAFNQAGDVFMNSTSNFYSLDPSTAQVSFLNRINDKRFVFSDLGSCSVPVLIPNLIATKTYEPSTGIIQGGDTITYIIKLSNNGNISASDVKLYDYIPLNTTYIPGSTTLNGNLVPDQGVLMPFDTNAVSGIPDIHLVNSINQPKGAVISSGFAEVRFKVKINPNITEGTCITNTASFTASYTLDTIKTDDPNVLGEQNETEICSIVPLPIQLYSFDVVKNQSSALINWSTSDDIFVKKYEIERSFDGKNYSKIGEIDSKRLKDALHVYEYNDFNVGKISNGKVYYRLKIQELDGKISFSKTKVCIFYQAFDWNISPNPSTGELKIFAQSNENYNIEIYNMLGIKVYSNQIDKKNNQFFLDQLSHGVYIIKFYGQQNQFLGAKNWVKL